MSKSSTWLQLNSSRKHLHSYVGKAAATLAEGALVLDAGAGTGLYRSFFCRTRYHATDVCRLDKNYGDITYVSDLAHLPARSDIYDLVLLTQVLEHVPEPKQVLGEIYRVLQPDGHLWLSVPLFFAEHEIPYDFYRYTRFGAKHLLQSVGFRVESVEWLEGYYGTLAYQLKTAAIALPLAPKHYGGWVVGSFAAAVVLLLRPMLLALAALFWWLDGKAKYTLGGHCKNYLIHAVK